MDVPVATLSAGAVGHVLAYGSEARVANPTFYPDPASIRDVFEPCIKATIMTPERYPATVMELCHERRGVDTTFTYLAAGRMEVGSQIPLAEVLFDFREYLRSLTQGSLALARHVRWRCLLGPDVTPP